MGSIHRPRARPPQGYRASYRPPPSVDQPEGMWSSILSSAAASAIAGIVASGLPGGPWVAPLEQGFGQVLQRFERPVDRFAAGHRGVDLAVEHGQRVRAIGSGVVTFVGDVAGTPSITVDHQRVRSSYLPVQAQVAPGDQVHAGTVLGTISAPAHCPRTCLHLGLRRPAWDARDATSDPYLDPIAWINRIPVLKPVTPLAP